MISSSVSQVDVATSVGATGRGTPRPVRVGGQKAQVSEYRDPWHPTSGNLPT